MNYRLWFIHQLASAKSLEEVNLLMHAMVNVDRLQTTQLGPPVAQQPTMQERRERPPSIAATYQREGVTPSAAGPFEFAGEPADEGEDFDRW